MPRLPLPLIVSAPVPPFLRLFLISFCLLARFVHADGSGLTGNFYSNEGFSGSPTVRIDPQIAFGWSGGNGAFPGIASGRFSARWEGQVEPLHSEAYTFHVTAAGRALLWVNDQLVVGRNLNGTIGGTPIEMTGSIRLDAGRRTNVRLEFIGEAAAGSVQLAWSSASQPRQLVPTERLYPAAEAPERGGILLERWSDLAGTGLGALTGSPSYPARPSGRESLLRFENLLPDTGDHYGQRISAYLVPAVSGDYVFAVAASDAAELWLGTDATAASRRRILQVTSATGPREFKIASDPIPLQQGRKYIIELLHYAGSGTDHFSVAWRRPGSNAFEIVDADSLVPAGLTAQPPGQGSYLATLATGHPRLFITQQRVAWLKQQLSTNADAKLTAWYNSLKSSADAIRSQPVNTYIQDNRGTILNVSRSVLDRSYKLALTALITGDTAYSERLYQELEKAANPSGGKATGDFPDWHPGHFLDVAEMTHAFAVAYDWLHALWTPARRDVLRRAITARGLTPGMQEYDRNVGWTQPTNNNWNLVCTGGLTLGALAIAGENAADTELVERILHNSVTKVTPVMARYTADNGGWYEGPGYWDFATDYNVRMMAALESALGTDFGLSSIPGLALTGLFPPYLVGPTRQSFNFADAGSGNVAGAQLFWLARRFNRPDYSWYQRTYGGAEALGLFWFDTRGQDPVTAGLPTDNWFRGATGATRFAVQDIVTLRSQWLDARATFVAAKAGEVGASHGNLDAGSFVLDALGQRWAVELGADDYALPGYFSEPQRWTYYRMRAEGQNTLVINPGSGADQVLRARPPVVLYSTEPNRERAAMAMDLTSAYAGATRVVRGFALSNRRRHVLIQDEIQYASPAKVWWFMHHGTDKTVEIADDGTSAVLSRGTDRLWLKILSGGGTFRTMDATPLPSSPNPSGQNPNTSLRKLAIYLPAVTQTTLAVYAVPLSAGEAPPASLPAVTPIADWPMALQSQPISAWSGTAASTPQAWSTSSLWAPTAVPGSAAPATIDFLAGQVLAPGQYQSVNDLPASLRIHTLNLGGTSTGAATVRLSGNALNLTATGDSPPLVSLNAYAGGGLSYDIAAPLTLAADTTFTGGGSASFVVSGSISGPGGLFLDAGVPLVFTGSNSYEGTTRIASGTLQIGSDGDSGSLGRGPVVVYSTLRFDRTGTLSVPNAISGPGALLVDCPIGAGTVVLSGGNTFTGDVTVRSGFVRITRGDALGIGPKTVILNNGTAGNPQLRLDGSSADIVVPAAIAFTTSNSAGTLVNEAGHNTLKGPLTLSSGGGNTKIVVEAGHLTIDGNAAPSTTSRNLELSGAGDGLFNGNIADGSGANTLGVIKSGAGTWTLAGSNAWTLRTSVNGGTLLVSGSIASKDTLTVASGATLGGTGSIASAVTVQAGGRLAPGASVGTLTLTGALTLASGSTTAVEIDAASGACDRIEGPARIAYGGTLSVKNLSGALAAGMRFQLFSAAQASGTFSTITPAPGPGLAWDFNPTTGVLSVLGGGSAQLETRLANLSVLAALAPTEPYVIVGTFVGGGTPGVGKPVLLRAVGPTLASFGVASPASDPRLELYAGSAVVASNDNWGGSDSLSTMIARLRAFPFAAPDSRDAALYRDALPQGGYTCRIENVGVSQGQVLVEIYDGDDDTATTATTPRLLNVSVRHRIAAGALLTAGFVLSGDTLRQVLIRAVGPTLGTAPYSVADALADPRIECFRGQTPIAANDNWGGAAELQSAFAASGAFALPASSKDAAVLLTLPPGLYSAQVGGVGASAGVVLVEIYEIR